MKKVLSLLICLSSLSLISCNIDNGATQYKIIDEQVLSVKNKDNVNIAPFNTSIALRTFCERDSRNIFPNFNKEIQKLHILFDRYNDYVDTKGKNIVNLKTINDSYGSGEKLVVDQNIIDLLKLSIDLSKITKGYFNPTLGELIDTWNYIEKDGIQYKRFSPYCFQEDDPLIEEVNASKEKQIPFGELENYLIIDEEKKTIEFKKYKDIDKITISLGAIAKGYAVERGKEIVSSFNVPALIDGGNSSSYGIGKNPNPDRDYWVIGLAAPYRTGFGLTQIAKLRFDNTFSLSVSGDYENCYLNQDGVLRHHILNPYTGYPENYYRVVSLKSDSRSDVLDGLSTAIFSIKKMDEIKEIIYDAEKHFNTNIEFLLEKEIDSEKKKLDIYLTQGYYDYITEVNGIYFNEKYILSKKTGD